MQDLPPFSRLRIRSAMTLGRARYGVPVRESRAFVKITFHVGVPFIAPFDGQDGRLDKIVMSSMSIASPGLPGAYRRG